MRVIAVIFMLVDKQALVRFGLNQQEHAVHGGRDERDQQGLTGGKVRTRQCHRKHQNDNCQRKQGNQILFNPKQIHVLGRKFLSAQQ
ncbi:hypothetical protein D3C86_1856860 [compost metagenome]